MFIFTQGNSKVKKRLGIRGNTMIEVEPTKRAKDNEFVFYADENGSMNFKRYKKVKDLKVEVYAVVNVWGENTKKIMKRLNKKSC